MSDLRDRFRPNLAINDIHQIAEYDPAYDYKNVIFTYRHDPRNVQKHLDRGWEIVMTTDPTVDDRSFTPNSKEKKLRPQECITKTQDKHEQVLMRILKEKRKQNGIDDYKKRESALALEAKRRGDKIVKRGNEVITKGSELNEGFQNMGPETDINFNEL